MIQSPSPSVKIQITGGKICLRCSGETLLGVLPLCLQQTFPPIIWIFAEGDGIESRLPFKIFFTLLKSYFENKNFAIFRGSDMKKYASGVKVVLKFGYPAWNLNLERTLTMMKQLAKKGLLKAYWPFVIFLSTTFLTCQLPKGTYVLYIVLVHT